MRFCIMTDNLVVNFWDLSCVIAQISLVHDPKYTGNFVFCCLPYSVVYVSKPSSLMTTRLCVFFLIWFWIFFYIRISTLLSFVSDSLWNYLGTWIYVWYIHICNTAFTLRLKFICNCYRQSPVLGNDQFVFLSHEGLVCDDFKSFALLFMLVTMCSFKTFKNNVSVTSEVFYTFVHVSK